MRRTLRPIVRPMLALFLFAAAAASCGGDDERPAECEAIVEACHEADPGSGPIHDCHEKAEETWSRDQCIANSASCLAMCKSTPDGGAR